MEKKEYWKKATSKDFNSYIGLLKMKEAEKEKSKLFLKTASKEASISFLKTAFNNDKEVARSILTSAYINVNSFGNDFNDPLHNVIVKLFDRINNNDFDLDRFEYRSIKNMEVFLKGSVKKQLITIDQKAENFISYEEVSEKGLLKKTDLFNEVILTAKRKTGKPLFNDIEKQLIIDYYIEGKSKSEIAIAQGKKGSKQKLFNHTKRQLEKVNTKILTLPIKGQYGFIEVDGIPSKHKVNMYPDFIMTKLSALRKYRRTKNIKDLDRFKKESKRSLNEQKTFEAGKISNVKKEGYKKQEGQFIVSQDPSIMKISKKGQKATYKKVSIPFGISKEKVTFTKRYINLTSKYQKPFDIVISKKEAVKTFGYNPNDFQYNQWIIGSKRSGSFVFYEIPTLTEKDLDRKDLVFKKSFTPLPSMIKYLVILRKRQMKQYANFNYQAYTRELIDFITSYHINNEFELDFFNNKY